MPVAVIAGAVRDVDRALLAPLPGWVAPTVRRLLAATMLLRLALGPYWRYGGQPEVLFRPPPILSWLDAMPSTEVLVALQVLGAGVALVAVARPRDRYGFVGAWVALLALAGLKGSLGKVLHNDVLLLLAAVPFLPRPARGAGWPVRVSALAIVGAYAAAGTMKLAHTGPEWVAGDNMRWVMYAAAAGSLGPTTALARTIADHAWLAHTVAAGILGLELLAPLALWRPLRPAFVAATALLHLGTWLTLGLDYWGWALTVAAVFLPWWAATRNLTLPRRASHVLPIEEAK
jgi:hypothetical protein